MASATDICNLALGQLGADRITNFDNPETDNEQLCQLYYPIVRDMLLEEFDWSFLMVRAVLTTPAATPPEWGFGTAFIQPNDCYRVINVRRDSFDGVASTFKWRLEKGHIICDSDTIYVRYIGRDVPTSEYSSMFVMAFAKRMAAEMCMQVTENRTLKDQLNKEAEGLLYNAINSDNMQGTHEQIHANTLQNARQGSGGTLAGGR